MHGGILLCMDTPYAGFQETLGHLPESQQREVFRVLSELLDHFSYDQLALLLPGILFDVHRSRLCNDANRINVEMCQHARMQYLQPSHTTSLGEEAMSMVP